MGMRASGRRERAHYLAADLRARAEYMIARGGGHAVVHAYHHMSAPRRWL